MRGSSWQAWISGLLCVACWLNCPVAAQAGPLPDFNGDGYADLVIGVPGEMANGRAFVGSVTIVYGWNTGLRMTPGVRTFTLERLGYSYPPQGALFGASLAWGDFDNDTYTDLAIGAPGMGMVFVIYGGWPDVDLDRVAWRNDDDLDCWSSWFGGALAAGDFNGDGRDDLAVGAPLCFGNEGAAQIFLGPWLSLGPHLRVSHFGTATTKDHFGSALTVGDFNNDGLDDLAVGMPGRDLVAGNVVYTDTGGVALYVGVPTTGALRSTLVLYQENGKAHSNEDGDRFGSVLASADFNRDGYDDLAVGLPLEDVGAVSNAGEVTTYRGSSQGLQPWIGHAHWNQDSATGDAMISDAAEAGDNFGAALAAGDFDGDGVIDLAIGVPHEDISSSGNAGAVHVLYGGDLIGLRVAGNRLINQNSLGILDVCESADVFGTSLTAGDYDDDGFDDLAIGVPGEDILIANAQGQLQIQQDAGAMAVLYGASRNDGLAEQTRDQLWHQQSASGVSSSTEAGDVFGGGLYGFSRVW
jgi:hypothetical protein